MHIGAGNICAQAPDKVVNVAKDLYMYRESNRWELNYNQNCHLPTKDPKHAEAIADFALHVQTAVQAVKSPVDGSSIRIRIGIHSGSVMAGVVDNLRL
eukprot:gene47576-biopygen39209